MPPEKTQAQELLKLVADFELFHTNTGEAYARTILDVNTEAIKVRSRAMKGLLRKFFFQLHDRPPSSQAVADAIDMLDARAIHEAEEHAVHVRVAPTQDAIYLHLANQCYETVEITADGWTLITNSLPVRFRRPRGMRALPTPERGGSIDELRPFFNLADESDFILLVSFVVMALRGRGPFPVLVLTGEQGSAKSTACRIIRELVDPNAAPLRRPPRDERDLMIAARNSWLLTFDNISYLPDWLSDSFCALATGSGLSTRELYSDDEEILFDAIRPIVTNGIEEIATRADLLDRCIIITLPTIDDSRRSEEKDLWASFREVRPRVLGVILDALSASLRGEGEIRLTSRPRMADFARWASAGALAFAWSQKDFLQAYSTNRQDATGISLEGSPVAQALMDYVDGLPSWTGTASQLLAKLEIGMDEKQRRAKTWPQSPRGLGNALRRLQVSFRRVGLDIAFTREGKQRTRLVQIDRVGIPSSASSAETAVAPNTHFHRQLGADDADDNADANTHGGRNADEATAGPTSAASDRTQACYVQADAADAKKPSLSGWELFDDPEWERRVTRHIPSEAALAEREARIRKRIQETFLVQESFEKVRANIRAIRPPSHQPEMR